MNKLDYVIRQIARTNKKNFENYVVSRIWHALNSSDIKFMTQQYVRRKESYALTDMYFPQLALHVEIDEPHHQRQIANDEIRDSEVIDATAHQIKRIPIPKDIDELNKLIDQVIAEIKERKKELLHSKQFEAWDIDKEFNPSYYRNKGYLDVHDNPAFRRIVDAANCLGNQAKAYQRAWFKSKMYEGHYLWFPKLYKNNQWDNRISEDGETIFEKPNAVEDVATHYKKMIALSEKRIVFARVVDNLGFILYHFVGVFETDEERSSPNNGMVYRRVATRIDIKR